MAVPHVRASLNVPAQVVRRVFYRLEDIFAWLFLLKHVESI